MSPEELTVSENSSIAPAPEPVGTTGHVSTCQEASHDEELAAIFATVKTITGHDFSSYKSNTIMRRIERRMAANETKELSGYRAFLDANQQEAHDLAQEILISVTGFFRDPEAFELLARDIIPGLLSGRDTADSVRIWHAGCATGEEVYSMAMLIQEYLDEQEITARVQIFATDIDESAIIQARSGLYPYEIGASVEEKRQKRFFMRTGTGWQVTKQLREMVVFAHHNLIRDPPFSRLDLLVCRNFLIYLNSDIQKRLIPLFHQMLKPGGFLFLGSAETVGRHNDLFTPVDKKWKIFGRQEGERPTDTLFPFIAPVIKFAGAKRSLKPYENQQKDPAALAEMLLLERYLPARVIVNEQCEVIHFSSRTGAYLETPPGVPTHDLMKLAKENLRPSLRAAIYKAFAEQKEVVFRGINVEVNDAETTVNIIATPLNAPPPAVKLALVIFEAAAPAAACAVPGVADARPGEESSRDSLVRQLEEQLRVTYEQLQATSEQLETSNEGFMSANEEMMSVNEELQSANEELHSTNEELETSKEELQALNEELMKVNAELLERMAELQQSRQENEFLANILKTSAQPFGVGYPDGRLGLINDAFELLTGYSGDELRALDWANTLTPPEWREIEQEKLEELTRTGQPVRYEKEYVRKDGSRVPIELLVHSVTNSAGEPEYYYSFLTDITERKQAEEKLRASEERHRMLADTMLQGVVHQSADGTIIAMNPAAELILGKTREDFLGSSSIQEERDCIRENGAIFPGMKHPVMVALHTGQQVRQVVMGVFNPKVSDYRWISIDAVPVFRSGDTLPCEVYTVFEDITERKQVETYRRMGQDVLLALSEYTKLKEAIKRVIDIIKSATGVDAVGIRLQDGDDFPYFYQEGFPEDFLLKENSLLVRTRDGGICRDECGDICLECTCGLIVTGKIDPANPLFTEGGSSWTNDSFPFLHVPAEDDPRVNPRNECIHQGFASVALIPIRAKGRVVGLLQLNDRRKGCFTLEGIVTLEKIAENIGESMLRKQAEESLRESEQQFRVLIQNLKSAVALINESGEFAIVNLAFLRIFELNDDSSILNVNERDWSKWEVFDEDGSLLDVDEHPVRKAALTGTPVRNKLVAVKAPDNPNLKWLLVSAEPLMDTQGNIHRLICTYHDFTDRKLAELRLQETQVQLQVAYEELGAQNKELQSQAEELQAQSAELEQLLERSRLAEALLRTVTDSISDPLFLKDRSCRLILANAATLAVLNNRIENVIGKTDEEIYDDPAIGQLMMANDRRVMESRQTEIMEEIVPGPCGNRTFLSSKTPYFDEAGDVIGVIGIARDITDRKRSEEVLRESEFFFKESQRAASIGSYKTDFISDKWESSEILDNIFGIDSNYIRCTQGWLDLVHPDDRDMMDQYLREDVIAKRNHFSKEYRIIRKNDGDTRWVHGLGEVAYDSNDIPMTLIGTIQDITERKQTENELNKLNQELETRVVDRTTELRVKDQILLMQSRQAAMGEMIGNIAHQWRQPLNVLGMQLQQLQLFYDLGKFNKELLNKNVAGSMELIQHMSKTIDDFRNFFKPDKEKLEFKVLESINTCLSLMEGNLKNPQINVDVIANVDPIIYGYPNEFAQVILNIMNNARDAFIERNVSEPKVNIKICNDDRCVVVTVTDNAGGIPEDIINKVFDPYFTTKGPQQGTGVGLFMSKAIIEKNMGGRLRVGNISDGAEFRIEVEYGNPT